ncbi:MAG: hypothetical protein Q9163_000072 [Psora crenata]
MPTSGEIPLLLLKSSSPNPEKDAYTTHLSPTFTVHFVPVLTHTLLPDLLIKLLLTHLHSGIPDDQRRPFPYGALILTSQRAVAALSTALASPPVQEKIGPDRLKGVVLGLYTVGPATAKALREIRARWLPSCEIHGGEDAGNGEILARLMLGEGAAKYVTNTATEDGTESWRRKPVLFLVGETRRDIIPKTLQSSSLPEDERIPVDEMVVYQSRELDQFEFSFSRTLEQTEPKSSPTEGFSMRGIRWIIVFSPMAGKGMLHSLGWLNDSTGKINVDALSGRRDFVCCIGQTTKAYLEREFGFHADVVADRPSPEGVRDGIEAFMAETQNNLGICHGAGKPGKQIYSAD